MNIRWWNKEHDGFDLVKEPATEIDKYAELLISMATDFLMKKSTKNLFISNLEIAIKKMKETP